MLRSRGAGDLPVKLLDLGLDRNYGTHHEASNGEINDFPNTLGFSPGLLGEVFVMLMAKAMPLDHLTGEYLRDYCSKTNPSPLRL